MSQSQWQPPQTSGDTPLTNISYLSFHCTDFPGHTMERFSLLAPLLLTLLCSAVASTVSSNGLDDPLIKQVVSDGEDDLLNAEHHFTSFKSKFGKTYATQEEHDYRFGVFKANLRRAKKHQMIDPTAAHGVTKFSDLTPKEFRRQFFGLKRRLRLPTDANQAPILPTTDLPADFDWRDHGAVTEVKDQVFKYPFSFSSCCRCEVSSDQLFCLSGFSMVSVLSCWVFFVGIVWIVLVV